MTIFAATTAIPNDKNMDGYVHRLGDGKVKRYVQFQEHELEQKIIENYWQIAAVKYNLTTLDAADRQVGEVYRQVEQFLNAGLCNQNDLLRVKLRQQELASQRLRLNNAQHVLLLLLAQQIDIARASVEQAAENLRISSLQYKAGTETLSNLLDAETLNRQAQNSLSNALADYQSRLAIYRLKTRQSKNH